MKSRFPAAAASVALMLVFGAPTSAQELSNRELKKVVKQAESAYAAGRYGLAIELYGQVLDATSSGDARRADALYASAMIRLSREPEQRNVAAGRRHLEELSASFPNHPRRLEVWLARSLLDALDKEGGKMRRCSAELAEKTAAFEAVRQRAAAEPPPVATESQDSGGRVHELESQLEKARVVASACQAELETSRALVKRLRDAAIAGSRR